MPRADRLKEEIGWLKVVFAACIAVDASLVAWLAQNYAVAPREVAFLSLLTGVVIAVILVYVHAHALRDMNELEDT